MTIQTYSYVYEINHPIDGALLESLQDVAFSHLGKDSLASSTSSETYYLYRSDRTSMAINRNNSTIRISHSRFKNPTEEIAALRRSVEAVLKNFEISLNEGRDDLERDPLP